MANVYYLKMNDPNQVKNLEFIDPAPENFPALNQGDLCFVRLEGESNPSALKRLWEFEDFVDNADGSRTARFKPHWTDSDGKELFFDVLLTEEMLPVFLAICFNFWTEMPMVPVYIL